MSKTVQIPEATTQKLVCDPRDAITAWQRRLMLPMSLWMAAISNSIHSSVRAFPSSTRVVGWTGHSKIATCSMHMLDRIDIGRACWPVHTDDGLLLEVGLLLNHHGTTRSSVVVHEDEPGSDYTSVWSGIDTQDIIHVAYTGHQASQHDVQDCSSTSADRAYQPTP